MRIMFVFVAIGILLFLFTYVGWRILSPFTLLQPWKTLIWSGIWLMAMLPLVLIAMRFSHVEATANDVVSWMAYLSLGFVSILFFFLLAKDLVVAVGFVAGKVYELFQSGSPEAVVGNVLDQSGESRRQMLWSSVNLAVLGLTGVMTGCGVVLARYRIKIERVTIPLKGLPRAFEGLRIVQISDIHVGPTIKAGFVREVVNRVNALQPDMIALTGDLIDGSVDYLANDVASLSDLTAPGGKFFVTGNHEYYSGVYPWLKKVTELGFDVLTNEHRIIERDGEKLIIGGVTDISAGQMIPEHRSNPVGSLAGAPEAGARILLAHQPISVYKAADAGYDLQLSGHTHGGQYFPYSKLIAVAQPFVAGLYNHKGTQLYVNRGTGYWGPPIRLGSPAEITEIILTGQEIEKT